MRKRPFPLHRFVVLLVAVGLSACGGGGGGSGEIGGGGGPGMGPIQPPQNGTRSEFGESFEPSNPGSSSSWETSEYWNSTGLALINASEGYANRTTGRPGGRGITVAVLDDGIDFTHSDLAQGLYDSELAFTGTQLPLDHGTSVAGVIAARRDGLGVHGVAYAANLQSIATCKSSGGCAGDEADIDSADEIAADIASAAGLTRTYGNIDSSPDASSHIMNMSFSYTNTRNIPQITSAMRDAAAAGRIMVAALGNCGNGGDECSDNNEYDDGDGPSGAPASNVMDSGILGYAIAVGSLNSRGTGRAAHSNTCGPVAQYCLFAPGEAVNTTRNGGGFSTVTGTSFAAPHVAGAAAVLWAAFPNKRGDQIVQRLLTTATPLDGLTVSSTFGRGALDLGAAVSPVGFLSLSTADGSMVPLVDSNVTLPPGFSAPAQSKVLANAIVYDEQMFPFLHDLASTFQTGDTRTEGMLRDFLSSLGASTAIPLAGTEAGLEFVHDGELSYERWNAIDGDEREEELEVYRLGVTLAPGMTVAVGQGFGSLGSSNDFIAERTRRNIIVDEFSVSPFAAFAGRGPTLNIDWELDDDTTIDFVGKEGQGYRGSTSAQLASLGLTREIGSNMSLGTRYGRLRERGSLMGIQAEGAFGRVKRGTTDFLDVSAEGRLSNDLTLFGSMSYGVTGAGALGEERSLISGWGDARGGSFVIGTEFEGLWHDSDRLTVSASSPFRADRATMRIDVPDHEVADEVVSYTRRTIGLEPSGREHRFQWVYERKLDEAWLDVGRSAASVAFGSYLRVEPDHDETADPEFGAAVRIHASF